MATSLEPLLREANRRNAAEVHLDPQPDDTVAVRYRIEGTLVPSESIPAGQWALLRNEILISAELDIAELRLPQDGALHVADRTWGVSGMPTINGYAITFSHWNELAEKGLHLDELGYAPADLAVLKEALGRAGLVFFAGPTHCGSHTSLYASLRWLRGSNVVVASVEAPVRLPTPGIRQIQVDADIGLNFAAALRALLRQGVDAISLGDLYDFETTEIAVRAAHRGKRVFASIHTNTAPLVVDRLRNIGMEPWAIGDAVSLVVGQRLLRTLCAECRIPDGEARAGLERLGVASDRAASATLFRNSGCESCNRSGWRGRTLIAEMLPVTTAVRDAIRAGTTRTLPLARTMRQAALDAACAGLTTVHEAILATPGPDAYA